jgi:anti-sigma regulatory factor (Ser/Thr protein kinase)
MEALLIDEWLRGHDDAVFVVDEASLSIVRERVRAVARAAGLPEAIAGRAALVATEIGTNQLRHARRGAIAVAPTARGGERGIEITGVDGGPGLVDATAALDAPLRAHGSLGVGVGAVRRLSSAIDVDVRVREGTKIVARLFADEVAPGRHVGIYGRPHPDERASGDHAAFVRTGDGEVLIVVDGLGHGPAAREAASAAIRVFHERHSEPAPAILEACHEELGAKRGAVMAVVRLRAATVEIASVGNVDVQLVSPRKTRRFGGSPGVVGARPSAPPPVRTETAVPLGPEELALLRAHPIAIAQHVVERHARPHDDALALVCR